jgi:hypothetical protein
MIPHNIYQSGTHKLFLILFAIRNMFENVADVAQITHGIRNIFADIRNVPTAVSCDFPVHGASGTEMSIPPS